MNKAEIQPNCGLSVCFGRPVNRQDRLFTLLGHCPGRLVRQLRLASSEILIPIQTDLSNSCHQRSLSMRTSLLLVSLALAGFVFSSGCEAKKTATQGNTADQKNGSDAHAGHDHSAPGPNNGHIEAFDANGPHFEWTHDEATHKLTIFLEEAVSAGAKVESVKVDVTSGTETKSFALAKEDNAKIAGSVFSIASEELMTLMEASGTDAKGVQSKLIAMIDGKEQTAVLKHEDEHGHKH